MLKHAFITLRWPFSACTTTEKPNFRQTCRNLISVYNIQQTIVRKFTVKTRVVCKTL